MRNSIASIVGRAVCLIGSSVLFMAGCVSSPAVRSATTSAQLARATAAAGPASDIPLSADPFEVPAARLVKEFAGSAKTKSLVLIGTRETWISFDKSGRMTSRYHLIYKIMSASAVDGWSQTKASWEPWHESRPTIKVRVIEPDGSVRFLDPKSIIEGSADDPSSQTFSDSRQLRAPIPDVRVGSIVDEVVTVREFQPGFPAGAFVDFYIDANMPIVYDRLVVELPSSLPFRYKIYLAPGLKPAVTRKEGRTRYLFEERNVQPEPKAESYLPYSDPHWPQVRFSTGKSWKSVATNYDRYVEAAIKSGDFSKQAAALHGKDLESTVNNIMAWMNSRVRYTGLYLGNHSIIPTDPKTTLSRGFGDCKDKAVLMAAILRAAGWHAQLALLLAGQQTDVDPALPSLGQFNHAIVYIAGPKPIWVDATEVYAKPNVIPLMDQGRKALIIDPSTTGLVSIPFSPSIDNTVVDTRNFYLTDYGYTDVKEELHYTGSVEAEARYEVDGTTHADRQKNFKQYVNDKYRFGDLKSFSDSDPLDLAKPFVARLTIGNAGRGYTDIDISQAAITTRSLSDWLPDILTGKGGSHRKGDFIFAQPLVETLRYIIHPPAGFVAEQLPQNEKMRLGTMSLSTNYSLLSDGAVKVDITLDTGKRRLTPAEFEATRKAYADYQNRDAVILSFDPKGSQLMSQGKYAEAFVFFRKLIVGDPGKPIQSVRYARALLKAGLQVEALKVIRTAIKASPKDAESYETLGMILEHDGAGRLHGASYDRQGAIDAYKKAVELDPTDTQYKIKLAHLYEYNADGFRYAAGSDMQKAVAAYEQLQGTDAWSRVQSDYWNALVWAHDWAKLREASADMPQNKDPTYYLMLCDVFQNNVDAALSRSAQIYPETTRRTVAMQVARTLFEMRRYPESYRILQRLSNESQLAPATEKLMKAIKSAKPYESYTFDKNKPADVVREYETNLFVAKLGDLSALKSIMTGAFFDQLSNPDTKGSFEQTIATVRAVASSSGISAAVLTDLTLPSMHFSVEGADSSGYRVVMTSAFGPTPGAPTRDVVYLVKDRGKLRVAGTVDALAASVGTQILDFLDRGQTAAARQWLDWVAKDFKPQGSSNPKDPLSTPTFQWFWGPNRTDARIAGAILLSSVPGKYARKAYDILIKARTSSSGKDRGRIDLALYYTCLNIPGWEGKGLPFAEELFKDYQNSEIAMAVYTDALQLSGDRAAAAKVTLSWLTTHTAGSAAVNLLASNVSDAASLSKADSILKSRIQARTATAEDYNSRAWASLFAPPVTKEMIDYARKAVSMTDSKVAATLNTLAAVYAARGRCQEAYDTLLQELKVSQPLVIQPEDWYVMGVIAEKCGLPDAAITYYKRVTDTGTTRLDPEAPYLLAEKRLAVLEASAVGKR